MTDYYQFPSFKNLPGLIHAVSYRKLGNLKPGKQNLEFTANINRNISEYADIVGFPSHNLVFAQQVHGNDVASVDKDCFGKWIPRADALVTSEKNLYLGINTADCVPVFFVEPKKKIIALAHSGWRGTLAKISQKVLERMVEKNHAEVKEIRVGVGPSICADCYNIDRARAEKFFGIFGKGDYLKEAGDRYNLDLKNLNVKILTACGIKAENIEVSPYCTSCQNELFFSYRKNKRLGYGEMLSVIGYHS